MANLAIWVVEFAAGRWPPHSSGNGGDDRRDKTGIDSERNWGRGAATAGLGFNRRGVPKSRGRDEQPPVGRWPNQLPPLPLSIRIRHRNEEPKRTKELNE